MHESVRPLVRCSVRPLWCRISFLTETCSWEASEGCGSFGGKESLRLLSRSEPTKMLLILYAGSDAIIVSCCCSCCVAVVKPVRPLLGMFRTTEGTFRGPRIIEHGMRACIFFKTLSSRICLCFGIAQHRRSKGCREAGIGAPGEKSVTPDVTPTQKTENNNAEEISFDWRLVGGGMLFSSCSPSL
ncbi:unnamed protein product [Hapterophycus canaliculatus]